MSMLVDVRVSDVRSRYFVFGADFNFIRMFFFWPYVIGVATIEPLTRAENKQGWAGGDISNFI